MAPHTPNTYLADLPPRRMPAELDSPSGMFDRNTAATATVLTAPPTEQAEADDHRLRDAVEQRADGDRQAASGVIALGWLLSPRTLTVFRTSAGEPHVGDRVDGGTGEGTRTEPSRILLAEKVECIVQPRDIRAWWSRESTAAFAAVRFPTSPVPLPDRGIPVAPAQV